MTRHDTRMYGRVAVGLHWVSALLILGMMPLGFRMQDAEGIDAIALYRLHVVVGCLVLGLTLARVVWGRFDARPPPPPELGGMHVRGLRAVHGLLYVALFGLAISGLVTVARSGLLDVLRADAGGPVPDLAEHPARSAHAAMARLYIGLLIAHVGGVAVHQMRHGGALARMGIGSLPPERDDPVALPPGPGADL